MTTSICFDNYGPEVEVQELTDLPKQDIDVPEPVVFSDELRTVLRYWSCDQDDRFAIVVFSPWALSMGGPNDEALHGHPLYERGMAWYKNYEITNSPWISALERANRMHRAHKASMYQNLRHIVMTFHDTLIEFVTHEYQSEIIDCSHEQAEARMLQWLHCRGTPEPLSPE